MEMGLCFWEEKKFLKNFGNYGFFVFIEVRGMNRKKEDFQKNKNFFLKFRKD